MHFADLLSKIHATWCTGAHMTSLKLYREEHYNFSELIAWANQNQKFEAWHTIYESVLWHGMAFFQMRVSFDTRSQFAQVST